MFSFLSSAPNVYGIKFDQFEWKNIEGKTKSCKVHKDKSTESAVNFGSTSVFLEVCLYIC